MYNIEFHRFWKSITFILCTILMHFTCSFFVIKSFCCWNECIHKYEFNLKRQHSTAQQATLQYCSSQRMPLIPLKKWKYRFQLIRNMRRNYYKLQLSESQQNSLNGTNIQQTFLLHHSHFYSSILYRRSNVRQMIEWPELWNQIHNTWSCCSVVVEFTKNFNCKKPCFDTFDQHFFRNCYCDFPLLGYRLSKRILI